MIEVGEDMVQVVGRFRDQGHDICPDRRPDGRAGGLRDPLLGAAGRYPMSGLLSYLIICPLVGIAGFVDAIAGGGGLISLPAYLIAGVPVHTAIGTNKLSSSMGTAVSTLRYAREGFIPWRQSSSAWSLP